MPHAWTRHTNLSDYLVDRNVREGRGDCTALLYQNSKLTYSQVADLVSKATTLLHAHGIGPGHRVILLLPDTPAFVVAFFATLRLGAICVPVNPTWTLESVMHIARQVDATIACIDVGIISKFQQLKAAGLSIIATGDCNRRRAEFEKALTDGYNYITAPCHVENPIAYCLFSSGTTGPPKGIPHRHTDILEGITAYSLPVLNMSSNDRVLAVPQLTFGYGLGGNLLSSFFVGGTTILLSDPPTCASISAAAQQYSPTLFLGQPRMISELLQGASQEAFGRLRLAVTAGEVLSESLYQRWMEKFNVELLDGFGVTEIGHVFISNHLGDIRPGCSGLLVQGFDARILDNTGTDVPADEVGHLWVRGPSLAQSYWNDEKRTREHFVDGWFRTGDLARLDKFGYITICGRADDMIKAGCGQWVSPTEIEAILQTDDAVADCAVVGYTDTEGVIRPKAYVVLRSNQRPNETIEKRLKTLVAHCWPECQYKHLGEIEFASILPRSSTGKLQRFLLRPVTLTEFSFQC